MSIVYADEPCCEQNVYEDADGHQRGHVKLFYSGTPQIKVEDPRDDYEWPGINDDAFYDYFTK